MVNFTDSDFQLLQSQVSALSTLVCGTASNAAMCDAVANATTSDLVGQVATLQSTISAQVATITGLETSIDQGWILSCAFLVFFMQLGFIMLESGAVRSTSVTTIILKNFITVALGFMMFIWFGYGMAFGDMSGGQIDESADDLNGFVANAKFFLVGIGATDYAFAFFQAMFACTAATIVSGSMLERTRIEAYLAFSCVMSCIIYPPVAHWVFNPNGFFYKLEITDFAGCGAVHLVGGTAALVGCKMVGMRKSYINPKTGEPDPPRGHSVVLSVFGTSILFLGWFGFNCGSTLGLSNGNAEVAGRVAINTAMAAMTSLAMSASLRQLLYGRQDCLELMNSCLCGLVAISSGCHVVEPFAAMLAGMLAGAVHVASEHVLRKLQLDDPASSISVHFVCGWIGLMVPGFFSFDLVHPGIFYGGLYTMMVNGAMGLAIMVWTGAFTCCFFYLIDVSIGLRVSESMEIYGQDSILIGTAYPEITKIQATMSSVTSFEDTLTKSQSEKLFALRQFLQQEESAHLLDFVLAIRAFRETAKIKIKEGRKVSATQDPKVKKQRRADMLFQLKLLAQSIYRRYISQKYADPENRVELGQIVLGRCRQRVRDLETVRADGTFPVDMFDAAEEEMKSMIKSSSWPRFDAVWKVYETRQKSQAKHKKFKAAVSMLMNKRRFQIVTSAAENDEHLGKVLWSKNVNADFMDVLRSQTN